MNLQKQYGALDARERLVLYLSALARGDRAEGGAVLRALPPLTMEMSDLYPHLRALETVNASHHLTQTETVLAVANARLVWGEMPEAFGLARYLALRYVVTEQAWRAVCAEHGFDYEGHSDRRDALSLCSHRTWAGFMAEAAMPEAEFAAWAARTGNTTLALPTVAEMRRQYLEALREATV